MENTPRVAVLLANTGSPDAPTPEAVRRYLKSFLGDPCVVEMPRLVWTCILYGVILPLRPRRSAAKYRKVWTGRGSPLVFHTEDIASGLNARFREAGLPIEAAAAMNYGNPFFDDQMRKYAASGVERILILPLFPLFTPQTVGPVMAAAGRVLGSLRDAPAVRTVKRYWDREGWVSCMAGHIRSYWDRNGDPFASGGRLFFSFHGIPKECVEVKGDRYQAECIECASRIASALGLREGTWETTFQSRFGPHEWLQPYTQVRAEEAGKAGVPRLDIVTPGFSCDCLETLEEIGMEVRDGFLAGNPKGEFHHIPCLNSAPRALGFYEELIRKETSGWLE
ncbi:MAG: ferrochelatase [Sutterellaceae bacterium]|nr:ferrochelatase [Sutterellaceae bacterium]MDD7442939.1 ferrochelatase [Sutterellaceae bacterium]MDY2868288.1 ferrochelatase [Mesosutterella sp.]